VKGNAAVRFSLAALIGLIASACSSGGEGLTDQSGAGIDGPDGLSDVPNDLDWKDTSPGWSLGGQKLLLTGTIYVSPGVPAGDVILYYYQTNPQGRYLHDPTQPRSMAPNALGQTHGFIRGWVRTKADGRYAIYTVRPGSYPDGGEPAHVHATLQEPNRAAYYIDDFVFDDDPLLTSARRARLENRAGSGVLRLKRQGDLLVGERDLYLGLNVPDHPLHQQRRPSSGRAIGEDVLSFTPNHAFGPDRGSRTCPVCKYGELGVLYFVGNRPEQAEIRSWLQYFEAESNRRAGRWKVYYVYGNEHRYDPAQRRQELESLGTALGIKRLALTFVPSLRDRVSELVYNRLDPEVSNTILIYRESRIVEKAVDLPATPENFRWISTRLDQIQAKP
jgi:protocatechuate 3,4-dioxygenase beta subunit